MASSTRCSWLYRTPSKSYRRCLRRLHAQRLDAGCWIQTITKWSTKEYPYCCTSNQYCLLCCWSYQYSPHGQRLKSSEAPLILVTAVHSPYFTRSQDISVLRILSLCPSGPAQRVLAPIIFLTLRVVMNPTKKQTCLTRGG